MKYNIFAMLTQGKSTQKESKANKVHNTIKQSLCYISRQSKQSYWQNSVQPSLCIGNCLEFPRILYKLPLVTEKNCYNSGQILDPKRTIPGWRNKLKNFFRSTDIQGHPTYQLRSYSWMILSQNSFCRK